MLKDCICPKCSEHAHAISDRACWCENCYDIVFTPIVEGEYQQIKLLDYMSRYWDPSRKLPELEVLEECDELDLDCEECGTDHIHYTIDQAIEIYRSARIGSNSKCLECAVIYIQKHRRGLL